MAQTRTDALPVHPVETQHRRITTLASPETDRILADSIACEPLAMQGQPPVVWDRAEGFNIYDTLGNKWIDFSSGVLVTNAGHGRSQIVDAIVRQARHGLIHNYCFPSQVRTALAKRLCELAPAPLKKVFLVSTGSETVECAIKLMRTHGQRMRADKTVIVSFDNAFHGRTLGAQMIGGIPALKSWIHNFDPDMIQVPFPDGYHCPDQSFEVFEQSLADAGVEPGRVAGVISETYQGGGASFGPPVYFQRLREWCDTWDALLTMDEIQAAFGRCGRMWGFEHYGIVPDLMCLGKGISSSLPVAAVVGRPDVMDLYPPGSMTSTHTGNPICAAAALANIDLILTEKLIDNADRLGEVLHRELWQRLQPYDQRIGAIHGKGLVAGVHITTDEPTDAPDPDLARAIVWHAVGRGLMLFAPVGMRGATIKISPPLCITEEALIEGVATLAEAFADALNR